MKIDGMEVNGPNEEILVIPRKDNDIVFKAIGVQSYEEFDALVSAPKAPGKRTKDGFKLDLKDPTYREQSDLFGKKRFAYTILVSLEPSNIEWETVKMEDPNTWLNWEQELRAAGFNEIEVQRIQHLVLEANCLSEDKLKEARERFLLGEGEE